MKFEELCLRAEILLQGIQTRLATPTIEHLGDCETELHAVIRSLPDPRVSAPLDDRDREVLQRLKRIVRQVAVQLQHGVKLCQGWAQLRACTGYTNRGRPVLANPESSTNYEA